MHSFERHGWSSGGGVGANVSVVKSYILKLNHL